MSDWDHQVNSRGCLIVHSGSSNRSEDQKFFFVYTYLDDQEILCNLVKLLHQNTSETYSHTDFTIYKTLYCTQNIFRKFMDLFSTRQRNYWYSCTYDEMDKMIHVYYKSTRESIEKII
mgnify:CR=1 FL=1